MTEQRDHTINALVAAARQGDRPAFDRLVALSHKGLVGFIRGHMPTDLVEPETVAQKVWLAVWEGLRVPPEEGGFDPEKGSFQSFVRYRFAVYILRREVTAKAKQRSRETSLDQLEEETGRLPQSEETEYAAPPEYLERKECLRLRLAAFQELFRVLFLCGGYPHQQMAVAFSKYIYGNCGDRVQRVHDRHGAVPLEQLVDDFVAKCRVVSEVPGQAGLGKLADHLSPLILRLPLKVAELMGLDKASRDHFRDLLDRPAGDTSLADYYAKRKGGATAAIPDWCYKVEKRVRQVLGVGDELPGGEALEKLAGAEGRMGPGEGVCRRCKLRNLPPCARPDDKL